MDLRAWLLDTHADLRRRIDGSVLGHVPTEQWHEQADDGGSSITWLTLHLTRHHDLALTTAIRNKPPRFFDHAVALGLQDRGPAVGLAEREDPTATGRVDPHALVAYFHDTFDATDRWLQRMSAMALDTMPDIPRRLAAKALLPNDEMAWLYEMWTGRTVNWLVQWPMLGHGQSHLGEAIAVRNRLGHSPF